MVTKICMGDLDENENLKRGIMYFIVWDRKINVISGEEECSHFFSPDRS